MAPHFNQRPKTQEDSATSATTLNSEQNQEHSSTISGSSGCNDNGGIELPSANTLYKNVSGVHHSMNPPISSTTGDGAHANCCRQSSSSTIPPPLPPFRQNGQNGKSSTNDPSSIRKYLVLLQDCLAIKFAPLGSGHQSHPYPFAFNCHNHKNCGDCGSVVVDDEDDLITQRQSNHQAHQRVVSNGNFNNSGNKCGRNSISEPLTASSNGYLQGNNLNNNNSSCSHQDNHFTLGSNNTVIHNNGDPQQAFHHKSTHHRPTLRQRQFHFLQSSNTGETLRTPSSTTYPNDIGGNILESSTAEVDHSLHALYLYKGFKEANLQCYWNSALSETFRNVQYKGYIVPSTILVGALPKFLSILRTAWSRQMLRSPAGYRIEFIGEIEEVIADPVQKGQFAPLSDSLCWAILELTSLGQEAFVDSIMSALQVAFPTMSCPSRELVFQTLEKLIKERKVYQTSRGYFVVTPDIFRYMISANFHEFDGKFGNNNPGITLDALLHPNFHEDKISFSHQSWESAADHNNRCSSTSTGEETIEVAPSPKLKRHNSLKLIRQRDVAVTQMSGSTGQRRHSLRLPKSKSCGRMNDTLEDDEEVKRTKVKSSTLEHISRAMRSLRTGTMTSTTSNNTYGANAAVDSEKCKKNKSLLSKLFPFRRSNSKSRNEKITPATSTTVTTAACQASTCSNTSTTTTASTSSDGSAGLSVAKTKHSENAKDSIKFISTQTQTSNSTEQLCVPSITLSSAPSSSHPIIIPLTNSLPENAAGRIMAVDSTIERSSVDIPMNPDCIHGDGSHQTRSSSRRSMSILDENPLYDVLQDVSSNGVNVSSGSGICAMDNISPNFQVGCPVAPPTFPFHHHRGESSRCSTLSSQAASSLGYGSQGHPSLPSNYSPNLDSGLASYGYCGDCSSMASNLSPCGTNSSAQYGFNGSHPNNNRTGMFPQPAKPTAYSSARYKNSYEWYKKRYPNYVSPATGRTSPLYASLTAPRSKCRSRSAYDSLLEPMDEKHGGGLVQVSENRRRASLYSPSSAYLNKNVADSNGNVMSERRNSEQGNTGTTTVTQAVKSTTNMELELLLPLGKIMKAALHAKKDAIKDAWLRDELGPSYAAYANKNKTNSFSAAMTSHNNNENSMIDNESSIKVNLDNTGAKLRVGQPSTKTEVTTVVNNNGVIETHSDSSSGITQALADFTPPKMQSTVAIKTVGSVTDVVLVNDKTGHETRIITNGGGMTEHKQEKQHTKNSRKLQQQNHEYNNDRDRHLPALNKVEKSCKTSYEKFLNNRSTSTCVKISDIGRDSEADEEVIKVC